MVLIDEELDHVDRISVLAAHLNLSFHPKKKEPTDDSDDKSYDTQVSPSSPLTVHCIANSCVRNPPLAREAHVCHTLLSTH